ncbi:MAG TPA: TonB-dependent receptor [Candidatus Baltobacteraceae bacterium]
MFRTITSARNCSSILAALFFLAVLAFGSGRVGAQSAVTGTATLTGTVTDAVGSPVVSAFVTLSGPDILHSTTDSRGRFLFTDVPVGLYRVTVRSSTLGTVAQDAVVVDRDITIAIQYDTVAGLSVIAHTNTEAHARFNVSAASTTPLSPASAAFEGQTSWRQLLEKIPGVTILGASGGSAFNAAVPDSPLSPAIVSINGAAGYETATVLDGMPLIGTSYTLLAGAGTDLGYYPMNSFSTADVVRGPGALSPTIVDSIGGSLVLSSPGLVTKNSGELSVSTDPYGGFNADGTVALRFGKLSARATYGIDDSPGPLNSAVFPASSAVPLTVNGQPFSCTGSCATSYNFAPGYAVGGNYSLGSGLLSCCTQASTASSQYGGSVALRYALSPSVSAEVFYAGQRTAAFEGAPLQPVDFTPPAGYAGSFPAGNSLLYFYQGYPTAVPFVQASSLLEEKISIGVGNGVLRLAALQNKTFIAETFSNPGGGLDQPYTTQLYGGGTLNGSPVTFNGGSYTVTSDAFHYLENNAANNRDLSIAYDTQFGSKVALGASYVQSYYNTPGTEAYSYTYGGGDYSYASTTPSSVSETTNESRVYLDYSPTDTTSVNLSYYDVAARYHVPNPDNNAAYTDQSLSYGAPRLGVVWHPNYRVAFRAAAGGGLALAPLSYLIGNNGIPSLDPNSNTYTVTVTNLNLRPEKSFGFDIGSDLRLRSDTVLSFDAYRDNLYGQLFQSTNLSGTFQGLPLYTAEYSNLGVSRYEGILLSLQRDVPKGVYGGLSIGLTRGFVVSVPGGFYDQPGCTQCANLWVVPGTNFNGGAYGGYSGTVPYSQGTATLGYRWKPQTFAEFDPTYYGPNNSYYRPGFLETDARFGYGLNRRISLLLTFRNLTGIYDGSVNSLSFSNLWGVPTISGPAYGDYGEEYGPRSIILTTQIRF